MPTKLDVVEMPLPRFSGDKDQLVLAANDDIEQTAQVIVKEAMRAQALEHARIISSSRYNASFT